MFVNWPVRFHASLRRRESSAKGVVRRLGVCEDTAKRLLRGERPGADVLMLACSVYGPSFTMELMHPGSELEKQVAIAEAFKRFVAEMDVRQAA